MTPATRSRHASRHRGYALLWCLFSLLALLSLGAIGTEVTLLRLAQARAQVAAEAAALAAAGSLQEGREAAAMKAAAIAGLNRGNNGPVILITSPDNSTEDLKFGRWDPESVSFEEALLAPDATSVTVSFSDQHPNGPVEFLFGRLLGLERSNVNARATVKRRPRFPVPTSTWILDTIQPHAIQLRQSMLLVNGGLVVRSNSTDAVTVLLDSLINTSLLEIEGGVNVDSDEAIRGMIRQIDDSPDPPSLPKLNIDTLTNKLSLIDRPGTLILQPGFYSEGLIGSEGQYVLGDGVYLFGGPGILLDRNATIQAENAIIVLDEGASLRLDGATMTTGAQIQVGDVDNPERIAITSAGDRCELIIRDGATLSVNGMIDCRSAILDCSTGMVETTRLAVKELVAQRKSVIRVGEETPHPIDLLMVE